MVRVGVIEAFVVEALAAAAGGVTLVVAARRRPATVSLPRSIRQLPFRHRLQARAIVTMAREHDARHPSGALESFSARETLRAYLPETIAAYLAVPPSLRNARRAGTLSADEEFSRQLRTLRSGIEQLRDADAEIAAAKMAQNAAFLNERFGTAKHTGQSPLVEIVIDVLTALRAYLRRA